MRVIVLGNLAQDETFAVDTLPMPGSSIPGRAMATGLGGKGANQAIMLARAVGSVARVHFVAAIGADARGTDLAHRLADEPLEPQLIRVAGVATDLSVILRDSGGENAVITTQAAAQSITPAQARAVVAQAGAGDMLVMQGNLTAETTLAALHTAGERDVFRVLNPSPVAGCDGRHLAQTEMIVLNTDEAQHFADALPAQVQILRTLGGAGAQVWRGATQLARHAAMPVVAVDPTGAGDCFLGAALAAMLRRGARTLSSDDLGFAARMAAITVSRLGTQAAFPTVEECADLRD